MPAGRPRTPIDRRALKPAAQRPRRRVSVFDPWQRAALAVHEMHLGAVWTRERLMERFELPRAQAKRDMARLEALPGVFVAWQPKRGGFVKSVSISGHVTRGPLAPIGLARLIAPLAHP